MAHRLIPKGIEGKLFGLVVPSEQELLHVFGFVAPGAVVSLTDVQACANILKQWWENNYKPIVNTVVTCVRAVATALDVVEGPQAELVVNTSGTLAGAIPPPQVTLCLKEAGILRGRSHRGRKYLWPANVEALVVDTFDSGYVTDALAAFNSLVALAETNGYPLQVVSYVREELEPVTTFSAVDHIADSQRRRSTGRGR